MSMIVVYVHYMFNSCELFRRKTILLNNDSCNQRYHFIKLPICVRSMSTLFSIPLPAPNPIPVITYMNIHKTLPQPQTFPAPPGSAMKKGLADPLRLCCLSPSSSISMMRPLIYAHFYGNSVVGEYV